MATYFFDNRSVTFASSTIWYTVALCGDGLNARWYPAHAEDQYALAKAKDTTARPAPRLLPGTPRRRAVWIFFNRQREGSALRLAGSWRGLPNLARLLNLGKASAPPDVYTTSPGGAVLRV